MSVSSPFLMTACASRRLSQSGRPPRRQPLIDRQNLPGFRRPVAKQGQTGKAAKARQPVGRKVRKIRQVYSTGRAAPADKQLHETSYSLLAHGSWKMPWSDRRQYALDWCWFLVCAITSSVWCVSTSSQLSTTFDEPVYLTQGLEGWRKGSHSGLIRLGTMPLPVDVDTLPVFLWERWRVSAV